MTEWYLFHGKGERQQELAEEETTSDLSQEELRHEEQDKYGNTRRDVS